LREALSRLNTEGFIRFSPREGFYNRELNQKEVFDLYELRKAIELHGIRLAIRHAKDEDIAANHFLKRPGRRTGIAQPKSWSKWTRHSTSGLRRIAMHPAARPRTQKEHREILVALLKRNQEQAVELLDTHISRRLETIVSAIKDAILHIYLAASGRS
jgi:DNA-binding GntR family transcriptional regulator